MTTQYAFGIEIDGRDLAKPAAQAYDHLNQQEYEQAVKWSLDLISHSQTGQALLRAMQRTSKRLSIKPWRKKEVSAGGGPFDMSAATAKGKLQRDPDTGKLVIDAQGNLPIAGTGKGSDVEIRYTPSMWGFGGASVSVYPPMSSPGAGRTSVLFHEMAHAYRMMRGNLYCGPMAGYDTEEEFFAILLSNIFVTDPSSAVLVRTLRRDHGDFSQLMPPQSTSLGFLQDPVNKSLVAGICEQEKLLTLDLISVNATFNPIKAYYTAHNYRDW
jgi:hypothetical protein